MSRKKRSAPRRRPLDVLYADERWLAVDKPAGIPVHGGAGKTGPSVLERVKEEHGAGFHLVHRLDRGTAGVLLLARDPDSARRASAAWPRATKTYEALAGGPLGRRLIDRPLLDPDGRAREARTEVTAARPLSFGPVGASWAELRIETGRLHQIRRHLAAVGHPVLMDDRHGDFELNRRLAEAVRELQLPRPKHLLLRCARIELPTELDIPPLAASLPRSWAPLLAAGGLELTETSAAGTPVSK